MPLTIGLLRLVTSSIISIIGLLGAVYMTVHSMPIPTEYWALTGVAVTTMAGVQIYESVNHRKVV